MPDRRLVPAAPAGTRHRAHRVCRVPAGTQPRAGHHPQWRGYVPDAGAGENVVRTNAVEGGTVIGDNVGEGENVVRTSDRLGGTVIGGNVA